jgi:ABC-type transport system involved in Fe-S cluster assembly fused permease/ATPase subunit
MPLEVGKTINEGVDKMLTYPIIHTISKNPIYTAGAISIILILIIIVLFRDVKTSEASVTSLAIRAGFWSFIIITLITVIHNKVLMTESEIVNKNNTYDNLFKQETSMFGGLEDNFKYNEEIIPVNINTNFE